LLAAAEDERESLTVSKSNRVFANFYQARMYQRPTKCDRYLSQL
jgi:hypothetical protein